MLLFTHSWRENSCIQIFPKVYEMVTAASCIWTRVVSIYFPYIYIYIYIYLRRRMFVYWRHSWCSGHNCGHYIPLYIYIRQLYIYDGSYIYIYIYMYIYNCHLQVLTQQTLLNIRTTENIDTRLLYQNIFGALRIRGYLHKLSGKWPGTHLPRIASTVDVTYA